MCWTQSCSNVDQGWTIFLFADCFLKFWPLWATFFNMNVKKVMFWHKTNLTCAEKCYSTGWTKGLCEPDFAHTWLQWIFLCFCGQQNSNSDWSAEWNSQGNIDPLCSCRDCKYERKANNKKSNHASF